MVSSSKRSEVATSSSLAPSAKVCRRLDGNQEPRGGTDFEKKHGTRQDSHMRAHRGMLEVIVGEQSVYHMPQQASRGVNDLFDVVLIPFVRADQGC